MPQLPYDYDGSSAISARPEGQNTKNTTGVWSHSYGTNSNNEASEQVEDSSAADSSGAWKRVKSYFSDVSLEFSYGKTVRSEEPETMEDCEFCIFEDGEPVEETREYGKELRLFGKPVYFVKDGENTYCGNCEGEGLAVDESIDEQLLETAAEYER